MIPNNEIAMMWMITNAQMLISPLAEKDCITLEIME